MVTKPPVKPDQTNEQLSQNVFENLPQNVWWFATFLNYILISGIVFRYTQATKPRWDLFPLPTNRSLLYSAGNILSSVAWFCSCLQPIENFFSVHWMQSAPGTVRLMHEQTKRSGMHFLHGSPFRYKLLDDFTTDKPFRFPESMADDRKIPVHFGKLFIRLSNVLLQCHSHGWSRRYQCLNIKA